MSRPVILGPAPLLLAALDHARKHYDLGGPEHRRRGAANTVAILIEEMRRQGVPFDALRPAFELVKSLGDLDQGVEDAMFKASRTSGRPPASTREEQLWQIAAVAVSILMDGGFSKREAKRHVGHTLRELGLSISDETVVNWRSRVTADLPRSVGAPGRPDDTSSLTTFRQLRNSVSSEQRLRYQRVALYLGEWRRWREYGKPHQAERFVARVLAPAMKKFIAEGGAEIL